jgi:hypothetical protein
LITPSAQATAFHINRSSRQAPHAGPSEREHELLSGRHPIRIGQLPMIDHGLLLTCGIINGQPHASWGFSKYSEKWFLSQADIYMLLALFKSVVSSNHLIFHFRSMLIGN